MARHYRRRQQNDYYDIQFLNDLHVYFPDLLYNIDRFLSVRDVLIYIRAQSQRRYNIFDEAQDEYNNTYYPLPVNTQTPREVLVGGAAGRLHTQRETQAQAQTRAQTHTRAQTQTQTQQQRSRFHARGHFQYRASQQQHQQYQQQQQQQQPRRQRRADHIRTPIPTRFPTVNTPLTTLAPLFDFNTFGLGNGFTTFTTFPTTTATPMNPINTTQADIDGATALLTLLGLATTPTLPANVLTPVIVRPSQDIINQATVLETIQDPPPTGICVICQDEYTIGNSVRRIRHCQHLFHNDCIMQHFDSSVRCPTCRYDIRDSVEANQ